MKVDDFFPFLAALGGAIVGAIVAGIFTLRGAVIGANKSATNAITLARDERCETRQMQRKTSIEAIRMEMFTILELIPAAKTTNVLRFFPVAMWSEHSREIGILPEETRELLTFGYISVLLANTLAQNDLWKVGHNQGYLNEPYRDQVDQVDKALSKALPLVEGWIEKMSRPLARTTPSP